MALNNALTPFEDPHKPGYTPGGAFAGLNAVLIRAASWDSGNPYESAPIHLNQLLAPQLAITGSADLDGFSCTITFPGWTRPGPPSQTVYTYPGNRGAIYPSETAAEQPWTPGDLIGLHQPVLTGPYLLVFVAASGETPLRNPAALSDAALTGPSGAVPVKTVDGNTQVPGGPYPSLYPFIAPGGFIIPVTPLQPYSVYHAHVVVSFAGLQTAHDWSFTTGGLDPGSSLTLRGDSFAFVSSSPAAVRVTFTRSNGAHSASVTIAPGHRAHVHLGPGSWEVCGQQPPSGQFAGYSHCLPIIVTGVPSLRFGAPHVVRGLLVFPLHFTPVLRGHRATLIVMPLPGRPSRHTIVLGPSTYSVPLPAPGHGVRLTLSTAPFRVRDAPWAGARTVTQAFVRR